MDFHQTVLTVWDTSKQWVCSNPSTCIPTIAVACFTIAASLYKLTQIGRISDFEEKTNIDFVLARRIALSKDTISKPENITIEEKYVEMPDGYVLFTRCYIPKNPIAMICYNHGYGDHINGMVHELCLELCNKRGYIVYIHEHYGHGRSDGLFVYCNDFNLYIKHSSYLFKNAKKYYGNKYNISKNSFFIAGESMGGAITIHQILYEMETNNNNNNNNNNNSDSDSDSDSDYFGWNGAILAAPMCEVDKAMLPPSIIIELFRYLIVPLFPKLPYSPAANMDDFLLSENAEKWKVEKHFEKNALKLKIKPRFITGKEMIDATQYIENNRKKFNLPFIVLHSKEDKVTSCQSSINFHKNAITNNKELKIYEKGFHMIWHDVQGTQALDDVDKWIRKRIKKVDTKQ